MKVIISALSIRNVLILVVLLFNCVFQTMAQPAIEVPDGYAAGTTGGGDATPITVSTATDFKTAIAGNTPAVIYVNGLLNVGNVSIGSNKTVVGMTEESGLTGGMVRLTGTNYIIQNLTFGPASGDVMEVSGATKVFITKCSFRDCTDELLSIVRQSDFVTVSWCKFYFSQSHSHAFGSLIGNRDDATADRGKLHVTMHHNWYGNGVRGRMPRVRYGHVHIYNNYFNSTGNGYCIGVGFECNIRLEYSCFESVSSSWADYGGASNGKIGWSNIKFVNSTQPTFMPNTYPVFAVPYTYYLDSVDSVKAIVTAGAGNVLSGPPVAVTGVSLSPDSAMVGIDGTMQLTAIVAPSNATNKKVTWSSSDSSVVKINSSGLITGVAHGEATITIATDDGGFKATCNVTVAIVAVSGVSVSPTNASVVVGNTIQLSSTVSPSSASNKAVNWSSNNTAVATVSSTGVVTGVAEGSATITVSTQDGSKTDSCIVKVVFAANPIQLINLGFNENTGNIVANTGTVPVTLTKSTPPSWSTNVFVNGGASSLDFGTTSGDYYVESSSVINELAGLNSFTITGWVNCRNSTVGSGGNRIVSWINNGAHGVDVVYMSDGSLKVGINQWPDKTIAISSAGKIPTNENGSVSNWKFFAITYESSVSTLQFYFGDNFHLASLDKSVTYPQGDVGTSIGKLAIGHFNSESNRSTRTDRIFRGVIDQIEVYNSALPLRDIQTIQNIGSAIISVTGIIVTPATLSINVGAEAKLTATIEPTNAYDKSVTWNSDNTSIATVNPSGLVTGVAAGSATITVTALDGGYTATSSVTIAGNTLSASLVNTEIKYETYPNPVSDYLKIRLGNEAAIGATIQMFDNTGRMITNMKATCIENTISMESLPSGLYLVKVMNASQSEVKYIVKK